jgi:hypothetical protein
MPDGTAERLPPASAPATGGWRPASPGHCADRSLLASAPTLPADPPALAGPPALADPLAPGPGQPAQPAGPIPGELAGAIPGQPAEPARAAPGPPGQRVLAAARLRLASRYRVSDVQTPRELRARLVRDARAVSAVIDEAAGGQGADPLDVADALVLIRSLRSYLDELEAGLLDGAEQAGLSLARAAACLGLTVSEVHYRRSVLRHSGDRPG